MKFPLSWLKSFINIEMAPSQMAKILTQSGIEVESLQKASMGFDKVVIGQVLKKEPHPNADKLCVAQVSDGAQTYQVVCGAPNCREGLKTALALVGATLTMNGEVIKIKKTKIRGVESFGMLCAGDELGIPGENERILEFAEHLTLGADIAEIYSDTVFEVALTPNMSHAASLLGLARELSAIQQVPIKFPMIQAKEEDPSTEDVIQIQMQAPEDCPLYMCRVVENVVNGESPEWLKKRLLLSGIRPINLAADISNYVLLEMGQPLHVFDLDKVAEEKIIVRRAKAGESLLCLDGKERELSSNTLIIADARKPLSIAGIMGGENSSVSSTTTKILIEAALFKESSIRRASKQLALSTDASKHFERGIDPEGVSKALDRAAMLLQELGQGKVLKKPVVLQSTSFDKDPLFLRIKRVNQILGITVSISEVEEILRRLHFKTEWDGNETLKVQIPSFRKDISAEIDLIEEVARLIGYDHIPRRPAQHVASEIAESPQFTFERVVKQRLIAEGLQEFLNCDLIGPSLLNIAKDPRTPEENIVKVMNPTSIEQSMLRTSLLQGLLQVVKFNVDHQNCDIYGFEVGRVHFQLEGNYQEPLVAAVILSGNNQPYHLDPKPKEVDFFDLKGIIENLLNGLNIKRCTFKSGSLSTFHPGRQALVLVDGIEVGCLGEIHPEIQRKLDVRQKIYFAELNLSSLMSAQKGTLMMKPIPQFPGSERDWTLTVNVNIPVQRLINSIEHIPSTLLKEVIVLDVFKDQRLKEQDKNVTLRFKYRDENKTLSQEEVNKEDAHIIESAEHMLSSQIDKS